MREPLSDELFEVVLKQAAYDAEKAEQDELPDSAALNKTDPMPQSLRDEFAALRKKRQRRGKHGRLARRIAVIAVSLVAVVFAGLMLQPEIRAGVSHIVVQQFQKFVLFHHDDNGEPTHFLTVDDVEIGYVPEGYELEWKDEDSFQRILYYRNNSNDLSVSIVKSESADITIDNEHSYEILYWNKRQLYVSYYEEKQMGAVVIPDETITVTISGNIEKEELLKVAKNIK